MTHENSIPEASDQHVIARRDLTCCCAAQECSRGLNEQALEIVAQQAQDILATLGSKKLRRIATYRACRWSCTADITECEANREWFLAKSDAWSAVAEKLDESNENTDSSTDDTAA